MTEEPDRTPQGGQQPTSHPSFTSRADSPADRRTSLAVLVILGTVAVTLVGAALFMWLGWLLSHQPAPLRGDSGWWDWLEHVDGNALFDAARTTATLLAVVGVGGAALVAYRRQDTIERGHALTIEAQRTAVDQFTLDSSKYQLDRERHTLELSRRSDDRERELRARFTTIAEQLGSSNHAVRHAGAYALASLADEWHEAANDAERQVCVDLLCAQLRSPRPQAPQQVQPEQITPAYVSARDNFAQDTEVRKTLVKLLRTHRSITNSQPNNWRSCSIDLTGADLSGFDLSETYLSSANFSSTLLGGTSFHKADLSEANLFNSNLSAACFDEADLTSARLMACYTRYSEDGSDALSMRASFQRAILCKALFTGARLPCAHFSEADLTHSVLHYANFAKADFDFAILRHASFLDTQLQKASFSVADLRSTSLAKADTSGATFDDAKYNSRTIWRNNAIPNRARLLPDD